MIDILINMADNLDKRGLHSEASKIDRILRKIAGDIEKDYFSGIKNEDDYDNQESDAIGTDGKEYPDAANIDGKDGENLSEYETARAKAIKRKEKHMENESSDDAG
jgi:hypothetical protein